MPSLKLMKKYLNHLINNKPVKKQKLSTGILSER